MIGVVVEVSCDGAPPPTDVLDCASGGLVLEDRIAFDVDLVVHVEGVASAFGRDIDVGLEPVEEAVGVEVGDGGAHAVLVGIDV